MVFFVNRVKIRLIFQTAQTKKLFLCRAMFQFGVDGNERPFLLISSASFGGVFMPESDVPNADKIHPEAKEGTIVFGHHDGCVKLSWTEQLVNLELSSFTGDHGAMMIHIVKKDNSLEQSLQDWIDFQQKTGKFAQNKET